MDTRDYNTPKDTQHLWLYEGMTQYLGHVLTVRGGLWDLDHYKDVLAANLSYFKNQVGRQWRSLEDTAIDSHHLRGGSEHWSTLRRGQDYYNEGALFWMEADAIIRLESDGRKSLDDFCRAFMGPDQPDQPVVPFTEQDILDTLNSTVDFDWAGFIEVRIKTPQETYPLDLVGRLGYRLQYATEPSERQQKREQDRNYASAYDSLGISVDRNGEIGGGVVPGMSAEKAGLGPGMKIIGINDRTFSLDRFRDAIADSVTRGNIQLLIAEGDVLRTLTIDYAQGPKHLQLTRDNDRPDILAAIMKPRTEE
jgi:predicted metalloprotease with PDZ domain